MQALYVRKVPLFINNRFIFRQEALGRVKPSDSSLESLCLSQIISSQFEKLGPIKIAREKSNFCIIFGQKAVCGC